MTLTVEGLAAWRAFLDAHASVLSALEREMADAHDLPLAFYDVLVHLNEAGGRLRMSDLAGALLVSRSGVTRLVQRMVEAGYVTKQSCPTDGRGAFAVLTRAGRAALAGAWPTHADGIQRHFAANLTGTEARELAGILGRVAAAGRAPAVSSFPAPS